MLSLACIIALLAAYHPPEMHTAAECRCAETRAADGWCGTCRVGHFAGVRFESAALFEVLDTHGHDVFADKTQCTSCRAAIKSGGFCDACQMGFVAGQGWFSRPCYALARGAKLTGAGGQQTVEALDAGWCDHCRRGVVGNRLFTARAELEEATRAVALLEAAAKKAKSCESCAIAMVANGACNRCRIAYRDGQAASVAASPAPHASDNSHTHHRKQDGERP